MGYDSTGCFPWLIAAAILLLTPIGSVAIQAATSLVSYAGMAVGAVFDEEIKEDMDAIGWNPFNDDETTVLNSSKVSFYKGVPVFRTNLTRSGSFCAIFLSRGYHDSQGNWHPENDPNTVRHEIGHNVQQMLLGPAKFGLLIGLPSAFEWSNRSYYSRPWEVTADVFGGVSAFAQSRSYTQEDIDRGHWYLGVSSFFGLAAYLFMFGEY